MILGGLGIFSSTNEHAIKTVEGYYTCSMHVDIVFYEPGDCPINGMTLNFISTANAAPILKIQNQDERKIEAMHRLAV